MPPSRPLNFERLVDWVEGKLPEAEAAAVAALVAEADEETRATVSWLQSFQQLSEETVLLPPRFVRRNLTNHFNLWAEQRRRPGLWQRLVANLNFDSQLRLGMVGTRTTGIALQPRQLIYSSEAGDVTLHLVPEVDKDELLVSGQIFPASEKEIGTFTVQLVQEGLMIDIAGADELNEFRFEAVPAGRYNLHLKGQSVEIVLEDVDLSL